MVWINGKEYKYSETYCDPHTQMRGKQSLLLPEQEAKQMG